MAFSEDWCVIVSCDGCGDGWATGTSRKVPHFRSHDAARRYVLDHGWTLDPVSPPRPPSTPLPVHAWCGCWSGGGAVGVSGLHPPGGVHPARSRVGAVAGP